MSTPHNEAENGQIAKTVLMPGDPLRARFIAENYLVDTNLVNKVRNMFCYTGFYKGRQLSVMGSGMGMPSMGIYSYELYSFYGVENIIRIGSAGSYRNDLKVLDVLLAEKAYSESSYAKTQSGYEEDIAFPSDSLNMLLKESAKRNGIPIKGGCVHSTDVFYREKIIDFEELYLKKGCVCVEMESFALFHTAKILNKNAACLLTISDSLITKSELSAKERETSFNNMIKIALNI